MRCLSLYAGITGSQRLATLRRSCAAATAGSQGHPLAVMDKYLRSSKTALNIHRELTLAIAHGNVEDAVDLARTLATGVSRFRAENSCRSSDDNGTRSTLISVPLPDIATVEVDSDSATRATTASAAAVSGDQPEPATVSEEDIRSAWNTPDRLTVTILETSFESVDAEEDENPRIVDRDHRILDEYLRQYGSEWKAQKHAIAKVVLDTARALKLTPAMIHHDDDDGRQRRSAGALCALKHCNVVVRGEVPQVAAAATTTVASDSGDAGAVALAVAQSELAELERALLAGGKPPLAAEERHLYLTELLLSKSAMSYSVGILKQLQTSLDSHSCGDVLMDTGPQAVADPAAPRQPKSPPLSAAFQDALIRSLNRRGPAASSCAVSDVDVSVLRKPVLPFTFMLKICLWYDLSSAE